MANIDVIHEVREQLHDEQLCFQWCRYNYDDRNSEMGYRFIWRDSEERLLPQRGQAIIYSAAQMFRLINSAIQEGWFIRAENQG